MATPATGNIEQIISVKFDSRQAISGLASLNSQIEQNTRELNSMAKAGEKGTKAYADLEQETKSLKTQKRDLSRAVQNEIKEQTTLQGSMRQMEAELRRLKLQYKALSDEEREHGKRGAELRNQINQTTNALKKAEYGIQEYYRNVGNYQNAILDALGLNGRFGQSIIGLTNVQGGFTGAMSAMGASVKAFGASLMALLTNPVFLAIAGIAGVGMAFKWFYDYNEGLAEATRLTKEFTGYVGDDLLAMRNSIQATAEVMDKEFVDVLKTADSLMQNFKIDGETAMSIINQGFAAGGDLNGDMLDKIQRLAPAFKNAGMSAEQLVALITQTRSGVFTDQGLDAIAMGTSRIRQFSDTMKKALQDIGIDAEEMGRKLRTGELSPFAALTEISAKLKELSPNTQEYGEVINAVFGKAGKTLSTEVVQGLADMSTSLDEAQAKTGQYGELLLENIKTEEELNNATSALFDLTNKGWEEIKQQAIIYAKKALVAVVKGLVDVANWFINLYNKSLPVRVVVNSIAAQFRVMWASAKQAFRLIVDGFKAVGRAINAIVNMFSQAGNAISAFGRGVYDIFAGIANRSLSQIEKGWSTLKNGIGSAIKSSWDGIMGAISASWEETGADFGKYAKELGDIAGDAFANSLNGHLKTITIPNFSGGGGGGGSNNNRLNLLDDTDKDGGGSRNKGGSRGSRSTAPKKSTTTKPATPKRDTEAERLERERQNRMAALIKKGAELETKAREEVLKTTAEGIVQMYKERADAIFAQFEGIETKTEEEAEALAKARNAMLKANLDEQAKELQKFKDAQAKKNADAEAKAAEDAKRLVQNQLAGTTEGTAEWLNYQLELIRMEKEAELALYGSTEEEKAAILAKYRKQEEDARMQNAQAIQQIEQTKYDAIGTMVGGLGEVVGAFGEQSKEAAVLQKTLALGEIMIAQAVAIANAVKAGSNAITPWQLIAQIATSIVAVTSAMAQAFAALDSAKFATGGYIQGAGTSTSDSIPVRVSNGESIMNANTTAMFSGLLSSLNQLGGGVPIQVQQTASSVRGEDMLARAVARGVAMLPAPVVSVEDINRGQRQVEVMNERATL